MVWEPLASCSGCASSSPHQTRSFEAFLGLTTHVTWHHHHHAPPSPPGSEPGPEAAHWSALDTSAAPVQALQFSSKHLRSDTHKLKRLRRAASLRASSWPNFSLTRRSSACAERQVLMDGRLQLPRQLSTGFSYQKAAKVAEELPLQDCQARATSLLSCPSALRCSIICMTASATCRRHMPA